MVWPNLPASNVEALTPNNVYLSKKDTVKSLKDKIRRIMGYYPLCERLQKKDVRVWKNFDMEGFLQSKPKFEEKTRIPVRNGVILNDPANLEVFSLP